MSYGYQCPRCGSGDTRSVPTIYADGTSYTSGRSYSSGSTFYSGSSFGYDGSYGTHSGIAFNSGSSSYGGTTQTTLAASLAPPAKKRIRLLRMIGIVVLLEFIGGMIASSQGYAPDWPVWEAVGFVFFCLWFLKRAWSTIRYNRGTYRHLTAAWQNSMLCQRCGSTFIHG